ncbi:MAG: hypothetical protein ACKPKO_53295, partial [Candidatus Fonsibacter sp.]
IKFVCTKGDHTVIDETMVSSFSDVKPKGEQRKADEERVARTASGESFHHCNRSSLLIIFDRT